MVNGNAVHCEQVWKEMSNYIDGEIDAGLRAAMDEHFRTCKKCASVLAGTQNVIRLYGDERMIEVPAGFGRRLEKRLARDAQARNRRWTWSAWLVPVAALLLIAGGVWWQRSVTLARQVQSEQAQIEKNVPPDLSVVVVAGVKEFHRAGCDLIRNKQIARTMTANEAIREGYVPCVKCLRKYLQADSVAQRAERSEVETYADADAGNHHGTGR
jgi:hypothetical protein